eukprot:3299179-Heterocapsa_arctica.AAC.1
MVGSQDRSGQAASAQGTVCTACRESHRVAGPPARCHAAVDDGDDCSASWSATSCFETWAMVSGS